MQALNILHVLRAPVGGLFRHVLDLARGQAALGHRVGIVADATTGAVRAEQALLDIAPRLALGVSRVAMSRHAGPRDFRAVAHVAARMRQTNADVVHGHGAKGGAYARLAAGGHTALRVYTPHGGSVHYSPKSPVGFAYLKVERMLLPRGNLYLFESEFAARKFGEVVGTPAVSRVVHNGVGPEEFEPVSPSADASDLVFLGEMRALKGVDTLIDAIAALHRDGRAVSATLIGDGPDKAAFMSRAAALGGLIQFKPPMPARQAFALGRILVVPSRAESLPYVVLEAAAAGKPLIATRVGGIPEIFGPLAQALLTPDDPAALARTIAGALDEPHTEMRLAQQLRERVAARFSLNAMVAGVMEAYAQARQTVAH